VASLPVAVPGSNEYRIRPAGCPREGTYAVPVASGKDKPDDAKDLLVMRRA